MNNADLYHTRGIVADEWEAADYEENDNSFSIRLYDPKSTFIRRRGCFVFWHEDRKWMLESNYYRRDSGTWIINNPWPGVTSWTLFNDNRDLKLGIELKKRPNVKPDEYRKYLCRVSIL